MALSKPRQTFRKGLRKRLRLDSDSEEEDPPAEPNTTPPKRQKGKAQITPVKPPPLELPEIKVQSPTPRKGLPDEEGWGTMRLRGPTGMEEADPYGGIEAEQVEYVRTEVVDESVVPSPATEDLPPLFKVESKTNIVEDAKAITPSDGVAGIEESGKMAEGQLMREEADETSSNDTDFVRQLRPISTFDSITLWTADVPLAGFRQDELLNRTDINVEDSGPASSELMAPQDEGAGSLMPKVEENGEVKVGAPVDTPDAGSDGKSTDVNPGWWRVGGAGEGGDEFVRGMGEWLGLVHMVSLRGLVRKRADSGADQRPNLPSRSAERGGRGRGRCVMICTFVSYRVRHVHDTQDHADLPHCKTASTRSSEIPGFIYPNDQSRGIWSGAESGP